MSRVQLALKVSDIHAAKEYYGRLFGAEPAKEREGYVNFAITDPPLKLVLIESAQGGGAIDHLGVEVETSDEVQFADRRLQGEGLATIEETGVICCYAVQDKVWTTDPDGLQWEVYTVLEDAESMSKQPAGALISSNTGAAEEACCGDGCCA